MYLSIAMKERRLESNSRSICQNITYLLWNQKFHYSMHMSLPLDPNSWLQIQRSEFGYSRRYQIFREVVGLGQGPLSLVTTIEELLEKNSSGRGLEIRDYGRGYLLC
jgi:hypothetical protein